MLMNDGTCPRCEPVAMRTTRDKIEIAAEFKDDRLRALAEGELQAGIATGMPQPDDEPK